jgi:hypothetical protein
MSYSSVSTDDDRDGACAGSGGSPPSEAPERVACDICFARGARLGSCDSGVARAVASFACTLASKSSAPVSLLPPNWRTGHWAHESLGENQASRTHLLLPRLPCTRGPQLPSLPAVLAASRPVWLAKLLQQYNHIAASGRQWHEPTLALLSSFFGSAAINVCISLDRCTIPATKICIFSELSAWILIYRPPWQSVLMSTMPR